MLPCLQGLVHDGHHAVDDGGQGKGFVQAVLNTPSHTLQYRSRPHGFAQGDDSAAGSPETEMMVRLHG